MTTILNERISPAFGENASESTTSTILASLNIRGTYFLNGPAKFHFDDLSYDHWLDGDGMVTAIRFDDGEITATSKFVQGKKFLTESANGGPIYRTFGTRFDGDKLYRGFGTASPYNVSVFKYQNRLLAFGEQSLPMELDPDSLETLTPGKPFDFDRQLNEASPFSAHPKIDDATGELLNFGIFFDDRRPLLIYYRFDADGKLACKSKHPIGLPCSLHDFAASENHVVFYLSPHLLNTKKLIRGKLSLSDALNWEGSKHESRLLVLCRHSGKLQAEISVGNKHNLHTINLSESQNGGKSQLHLDVIEYDLPLYDQYHPLPNLFAGVSNGVPTRIEIDLDENKATKVMQLCYGNTPDFPVVKDGVGSASQNEFWVLGISNWDEIGAKFHDQLAHLSWDNENHTDVWTAPSGWFMAGEPALAQAESGKEILLAPLLDAAEESSHIGLFNPQDVASGPIQTIKLGHRIPLCFHSSFYVS